MCIRDRGWKARYYIEGIGEYLKKSGKNLSFNMFSTCPHAQMFEKVENLRMQGGINDIEAVSYTHLK